MQSVFCLPKREPLEDASRDPLQFAKTRQVVLKFGVHHLRFGRAKLHTQDHVAKFHRMRKKGILLKFFKGDFCVVVIHKSS